MTCFLSYMNMRFLTVISLLLATLQCFGQKDAKAKEVLDAVAANYAKSSGTEIVFGGTMDGTIALKGEKFMLDCGGIKSWFDGKTLWSYVEENAEVNVSNPTDEELQAINPYAMLGMYKHGFNYAYAGNKNRKGTACKELVMTPEKNHEVKKIVIDVNGKMEPVYISIENRNGDVQEFVIRRYTTKQLDDRMFRFDKAKYPDAEIIDLR